MWQDVLLSCLQTKRGPLSPPYAYCIVWVEPRMTIQHHFCGSTPTSYFKTCFLKWMNFHSLLLDLDWFSSKGIFWIPLHYYYYTMQWSDYSVTRFFHFHSLTDFLSCVPSPFPVSKVWWSCFHLPSFPVLSYIISFNLLSFSLLQSSLHCHPPLGENRGGEGEELQKRNVFFLVCYVLFFFFRGRRGLPSLSYQTNQCCK